MDNKIIFDYSKLNGKITEKFKRQNLFIEKISMSAPTFIRKINNGGYFSQDEMEEILNVLGISLNEIPNYFFVKQVRKT